MSSDALITNLSLHAAPTVNPASAIAAGTATAQGLASQHGC